MESHTTEIILVLLGCIAGLIGWMWNKLHTRVEDLHRRVDEVLLRDPGTRGRSTD